MVEIRQSDMASKPAGLWARHSAASPKLHVLPSEADPLTAILSNAGKYSVFLAHGDAIRFATSPRLVKYTRIKRWDDGYLEVGADYGHGEVEDYIDIRQILDNLYYDTDSFLEDIKKVEVRYE